MPKSKNESGESHGLAIAELRSGTTTPLDQNDLGRLAQLHTNCQALSEAGGACGELAAAVANLLEGVILKEAADTESGLTLIPKAVDAMAGALEGDAADASELLSQIRAAATGATPSPATGPVESASQAPQPRPEAVAPPQPKPVLQSASTEPAQFEAYQSEPLMIDLDERDHIDGFIDEAGEHMDAIEGALLEVEKDPRDAGKINELFRPFHTIKGIAGFLNLRDINRLTHEIETILDLGRKHELTITAETIDLIFSGIDVLKEQIGRLAAYMANPTGGPVPQPDIVEIMSRLRAAASGSPPPAVAAAPVAAQEEQAPAESEPTSQRTAATSAPAGEETASTTRADTASSSQAADTSIRVDTAKLDLLVDAVGELVIAQTMVNLNEAVGGDETLARNVTQVTKIVRDVQETAMAMRMVPIGHTFQKMRRLVRDVSRKAGKDVELVISGEETELDKNVIQAISDPLVHMVRNAVDHGIEPPEGRDAAGKPRTGVVHLNAFHQGDSIVIEIRDDGRGLDREKLIAKGVEKGLVSASDQLTDQQAYALVIQPGFSTAEKITDISGRGVGMDVVKRNVEQLRGKIDISSELGAGSVFSIRLPLTLAIIDGMLVRVGNERMIIPTIMIEQSLRPTPKQITRVQNKGTMILVRGELISLVQLGPLFGFSKPTSLAEGLVVIAQTESHKIGIVVDQLIGQQQVVIKTLGERFKQVRGVSGAAILGDGHVGLIIEPTGLLAMHNSNKSYYTNDILDESEEPSDGSQTQFAELPGGVDAETPEAALA